MATSPPPTWTIEPTILYVVSYFETNSTNQEPLYVDPVMYDYNTALARAKDLIYNTYSNVGVCTIQQTTATVVYPATEWEDF